MAQEATSPAKARHYGPSFQQLLLLAFLLIAGLLGTSALRTLFTLEALMTESQASAAQAAALNVAAQTLDQRGQALERAARQSLVLGDAQLRQGFDDMAADARRLVQQLEDAGLPPEQARQWRSHMDTVHELLRAPPGLSLEHERSVADEFVALDNLHAAISQAVQELNARKSSELDAMVQASREAVTHQLLGAIVLALVLALSLGVWLARPFKRLERAIRRLGENQLERPVAITGPADVRRVGQQLGLHLVGAHHLGLSIVLGRSARPPSAGSYENRSDQRGGEAAHGIHWGKQATRWERGAARRFRDSHGKVRVCPTPCTVPISNKRGKSGLQVPMREAVLARPSASFSPLACGAASDAIVYHHPKARCHAVAVGRAPAPTRERAAAGSLAGRPRAAPGPV